MNNLDAFRPGGSVEELRKPEHVADDFAASGVKSKADIRAVFANNFFFGCEADDRATMCAFDPRMGGCGLCSVPTSRILTWLILTM